MLSRHILKAVPNFLTLKITRNWRKGKIFRSQIQAEKKNICRAEKKSILIVSLVWAELGDLQADTNLLRAISARSEMLCWIYTTESFWLKLSERNLIFQTFLWDAHVSCTWVPSLQWAVGRDNLPALDDHQPGSSAQKQFPSAIFHSNTFLRCRKCSGWCPVPQTNESWVCLTFLAAAREALHTLIPEDELGIHMLLTEVLHGILIGL